MTRYRLFLTTALVAVIAVGAIATAPIVGFDDVAWAAGNGNSGGGNSGGSGESGGDGHSSGDSHSSSDGKSTSSGKSTGAGVSSTNGGNAAKSTQGTSGKVVIGGSKSSGGTSGQKSLEELGLTEADVDGDAKGPQGSSDAGNGSGSKASQTGQTKQGGGSGQTGPGVDSDGKGPQSGAPSVAGGGKPVWSQEGIPEVELGRLNVARSPDAVLDRAYAEALLVLPASADLYNQSFEDILVTLKTEWDTLTLVDSPLANLALLKDAMDGSIDLASVGITNDAATLSAVFLGIASDKTVPVTLDTVKALSVIFGTPLTEAEADALATQSELVRISVLEGHG